MPRRSPELWYALVAIILLTAVYLVAYLRADDFPTASGLVGHGIGILGFSLMLMTATLYSIRKRRRDGRWGSAAAWLRFHMVTGLVGPYLVLLHTAMDFHGLAGLSMVLTGIVVISGLVGRYIYTAVVRLAGEAQRATETDLPTSHDWAGGPRRALATWHLIHVPLAWALFAAALAHVVAALYYSTLQR